MRRWNGEYVIILLVSGIFSETNGFQKSDLRVSDHTRSSRSYSNQLIPWIRQLSGSIQKWFLLPSVSISALSVPSNTGVLSSVRYLISQKKRENSREIMPVFWGLSRNIALIFHCTRIWSSYLKFSIIFFILIQPLSPEDLNQSPNYSGTQTISCSQVSMNLTFNESALTARQTFEGTSQSTPSSHSCANTSPQNLFFGTSDLSNITGTASTGKAPVTFTTNPISKREYSANQILYMAS